jgi:D-xylose transport system permease protein
VAERDLPPGASPQDQRAPSSEPPGSGGPNAPVGHDVDLTAADEGAAPLVPAAIVAQTLPQYFRAQLVRVKSGDSGVLPVLLGLIAIVVVFQAISPHHVFLSAGNIVNLFQQSAVFMVLGMAEIFVLLLGEIDLSIGYGGAVGAVIAVQLVQPVTSDWPWWASVVVALVAIGLVGALWGTLITRLRLPSFIVTLAGLLIMNGVLLIVLAIGPFSGYPTLTGSSVNLHVLYDLMWGVVTPAEGWIAVAVIAGLFSLNMFLRDERRRRSGLVAPPRSLSVIKIVLVAAIGVGVVAICNVNRASVGVLEGVPWVIFIVLGVFGVWSFLLQRMRFGRYVYAIGGNAEAARRAGVNVSGIRTWAFALCGLTAAIAGLLYASYLGGMSNNVNGGQLVLYAVAAAVIGGTSLFGGRGRMSHAVLGGLVIGGIYNGMYLQGLSAQWQFIVTGLVLLAAVTVDAVSRRGSGS